MEVFRPDMHGESCPKLIERQECLSVIASFQCTKYLFEYLIELRMIVDK